MLKCGFTRFSPAQTSTIYTPNRQQIYINIPREDSVISLINSYLHLNFKFIKKAESSRYAYGNGKRLVNFKPIASFSSYNLTASSAKHLEDISHGHIVSLIYKVIASAKGSNCL